MTHFNRKKCIHAFISLFVSTSVRERLPNTLSFRSESCILKALSKKVDFQLTIRAHFQNLINPLLMKIEFLTSLYRITLELVTEWTLDPNNSRKYFFFKSKFCFPIDMCINSVKETCFSQKYQKWIYQVLEINSSIIISDIAHISWLCSKILTYFRENKMN